MAKALKPTNGSTTALSIPERDAQFLKDQRVDLGWVYRRRGRESLAAARAQMRISDKWVLSGFPFCRSCRISLRSRKGSCLGCSKQIEHVFRYTETGEVYILASSSIGLIKVGSTLQDASLRTKQLNAIRYAGTSDWKVCHSEPVHRCGLFEDWFKSSISEFCENVPYERHGTLTYTRETYRCSPASAKRMYAKSLAVYLLGPGYEP